MGQKMTPLMTQINHKRTTKMTKFMGFIDTKTNKQPNQDTETQ